MAYLDLQSIEQGDLVWRQLVILGLRADNHQAVPSKGQGAAMGVSNRDVQLDARVFPEVSECEGRRVRDQELITRWGVPDLDRLGAKSCACTAKHRLHARPNDGAARVQGTPFRDRLLQHRGQGFRPRCHQSVAALAAAGFQQAGETIRTVPWVWTDSVQELWAYFQAVTVPFKPLLERIPAAEREAVGREVCAELARYWDGKQVNLTAQVVVATGVR